MIRVLVLIGALLACTGAWAAVSPDEMLKDPALEERARALGQELRCLVCQNQSIDDSDADLARDLRHVVRERLLDGATDEEVKDYLVDRYGAFVLLRPPVQPSTWMLWAGPAIIFLLGATAVHFYVRRRPTREPAAPLSEDERARLEAFVQRRGDTGTAAED